MTRPVGVLVSRSQTRKTSEAPVSRYQTASAPSMGVDNCVSFLNLIGGPVTNVYKRQPPKLKTVFGLF